MPIEIIHADNAKGLQDEVNFWLREKPQVEIVQMVQNVIDGANGKRSFYLTMLWRERETGLSGKLKQLTDESAGARKEPTPSVPNPAG